MQREEFIDVMVKSILEKSDHDIIKLNIMRNILIWTSFLKLE